MSAGDDVSRPAAGVRTRSCADGDLDAVARIEAELFGAESWTASAWRELVGGPGRRAWVATTPDDEVVGHALTGLVGDFVELLRIGVRPRHRRTGVAADLLAAATRAALRDEADRMLLEVSATNTGALAFYDSHGFVRIDLRARYYRDGSDALVLERRLDRPVPGPGVEDPSERMEP